MGLRFYEPRRGVVARGIAAFFLLAIAFFAAREGFFWLLATQPLSVEDLGEGTAARDLGIVRTVGRTKVLRGSDINNVRDDTLLSELLPGGPGLVSGADLRVTVRSGETFEVDLQEAATVGDVLREIENAAAVEGRVREDGDGIVLEDLSQGGGSLAVESVGESKVAEQLGLAGESTGALLIGESIVGELWSLPLEMVNGGAGVGLGTIKITDKRGRSEELDLSGGGVDTVGGVVEGINSLRGVKVIAGISEEGDAIIIRDRSGLPFGVLGREFSAAHIVAAVILLSSVVGVYFVVNRPRVADFLIEVEGELKKVSWPTRREVVGGTVVVLILVIVLAVYIYAADSVMAGIIRRILRGIF